MGQIRLRPAHGPGRRSAGPLPVYRPDLPGSSGPGGRPGRGDLASGPGGPKHPGGCPAHRGAPRQLRLPGKRHSPAPALQIRFSERAALSGRRHRCLYGLCLRRPGRPVPGGGLSDLSAPSVAPAPPVPADSLPLLLHLPGHLRAASPLWRPASFPFSRFTLSAGRWTPPRRSPGRGAPPPGPGRAHTARPPPRSRGCGRRWSCCGCPP